MIAVGGEIILPNIKIPSLFTSSLGSSLIFIKKGDEPEVLISMLEDSILSIEAVLNVLELLPKSYTLEVEGIMFPCINM